jgi:hypothetical protein
VKIFIPVPNTEEIMPPINPKNKSLEISERLKKGMDS